MDIAIIGMHCKFPQANSTKDYWNIIKNGKNCFSPLTTRPFYSILRDKCSELGVPLDSVGIAGLIEDPYSFDNHFFKLTGKEAMSLDPQARVLLECAYHLVEESQLDPFELRGSNTGLFVGLSNNEYMQDILLNFSYGDELNLYHATGNSPSAIVGRVAYYFDWKGQAISIDTACSSSSSAVIQACNSLNLGQVDLAVAGGVNLILSYLSSLTFSKSNMLSPNAQCRPFDLDANGYVRGEGCGLIMLKKLPDAIRDSNNILAVIKSYAINHDGFSNGITAPNPKAQSHLIKSCWDKNISIRKEIDYLEAHGTGTKLGDPIEGKALTDVIRELNFPPVTIGSVKSNIGHLEAAAGVAGIIKGVLIGQNGMIPEQYNFNELNPLLNRYSNDIIIQKTPKQLFHEDLNIGISSFGFSGTNTHIRLQVSKLKEITPKTPQLVILGISARDNQAIEKKLKNIEIALRERQVTLPSLFHKIQYHESHVIRTAILAENIQGIQNAILKLTKHSNNNSSHELPSTINIFFKLDEIKEKIDLTGIVQNFNAYIDYSNFRLSYDKHSNKGSHTERIKKKFDLHYYQLFFLLINNLDIPLCNNTINRKDKSSSTIFELERLNDTFTSFNSLILNQATNVKKSNEELTLTFGYDIRITPPPSVDFYSENYYKNTLATIGILYSLNLINNLPKLHLSYYESIPQLMYPFARKYHYHDFTSSRIKPNEYVEKNEINKYPLKEYVETWSQKEIEESEYNHNLLILADSSNLSNIPNLQTLTESFKVINSENLVDEKDIINYSRIILCVSLHNLYDIESVCLKVIEIYQSCTKKNGVLDFSFSCVVDSSESMSGVLYHTLSGFMSTLALENPITCGLLILMDDLKNQRNWNLVANLLDVENELFVQIINGECKYKRIIENTKSINEVNTTEQDILWEAQSIIISGASSGIGLELAQHILRHAPKELILLGRRKQDDVMTNLIDEGRKLKVKVRYISSNISNKKVLNTDFIKLVHKKNNYVLIHAAGVLGKPSHIDEMSKSYLKTVWSGKVKGLINLINILDRSLSTVYLFSSVSALWGLSGGSAYSMANGFLKGLSSDFFPNINILNHQWGIWEIGRMLSNVTDSGTLNKIGLYTHSTKDAFNLIERSLITNKSNTIAISMDTNTVSYGLTKVQSIFSEITKDFDNSQHINLKLSDMGEDVIISFIIDFLFKAEKIKLDRIQDINKGFYDLGLNSLSLLELSTSITNRYGVLLSTNDFFDAPTIKMLATLISQKAKDIFYTKKK